VGKLSSTELNAKVEVDCFDRKKNEKLVRPAGGSWKQKLVAQQVNPSKKHTCERDGDDSVGLEAKITEIFWRDHDADCDMSSNATTHPMTFVWFQR